MHDLAAAGYDTTRLCECGARSQQLVDVAGCEDHDLLYVYAYPQGTLEGQITDIMNPGGDCTDAKGNVYVT